MHDEREPLSSDDDNSTFEVDTENTIPKNIDEDLQQWIDTVNPHGDASYTCTLYKYDHPRHGNRKEFCGSFEDESPCLEDIGNRYGGGRYLLYVVIYSGDDDNKKNKQVKSYKFKINDFYTKKNQLLTPQPQQQQQNAIDVINTFRELMSTFIPLLTQQQQSKPNYTDNMTMVNSILRDSAKNQLELMREFRQEISNIRDEQALIADETENDDDEDAPEEKTMGIIQIIEPLLEKYLPILLGNGPQSKMAIAAVKAVPEFKRVLGDQTELSSLVQHIIDREGKESALKLMKKLKISIDQLSEATINNLQ